MLAVRLKEMQLRSDISCEQVFPFSLRCRVFSALLPCIPSPSAFLRSLDARAVALRCPACARGEPARSAPAAVLRPSLSICLLSFCALPKGFPASSALETSWGECRLPALPAHLLFYFFPFSFFFFSPRFLFFTPAPWCDSHWFLVSNWQHEGVYLMMMMISLCIWFAIYCRSPCNAGCW